MIISAVIPVRNGKATLDLCLQSLRNQIFDGEVEIIVIDSESSDDSIEIAELYGAKVISIPKSDFNHGTTRNLALKHSSGDLIYFTVQDAYFADDYCFRKMISHFEDNLVVGVNGMQAVPKSKSTNPGLWFKRTNKPKTEVLHYDTESFNNLSTESLYLSTAWDNVNAMYRFSYLKVMPFRKTTFGEDMVWAKDTLSLGHKIIRDSSIVVYHYHHLTFNYTYKMTLLVGCFLYLQIKKLPDFPSFKKIILARNFHVLTSTELSFKEKMYWIAHNMIYFISVNLAILNFYRIKFFFGNEILKQKFDLLTSNVPQGKVKSKP